MKFQIALNDPRKGDLPEKGEYAWCCVRSGNGTYEMAFSCVDEHNDQGLPFTFPTKDVRYWISADDLLNPEPLRTGDIDVGLMPADGTMFGDFDVGDQLLFIELKPDEEKFWIASAPPSDLGDLSGRRLYWFSLMRFAWKLRRQIKEIAEFFNREIIEAEIELDPKTIWRTVITPPEPGESVVFLLKEKPGIPHFGVYEPFPPEPHFCFVEQVEDGAVVEGFLVSFWAKRERFEALFPDFDIRLEI